MSDIIRNRLTQHMEAGKEYLRSIGMGVADFKTVCIALQGSQNYGMEHANSDIDSKFLYMPTLRGKLLYPNAVHTVIMENSEHVEVRPLDSMVDLWLKGNINALEVLFSKHVIATPNSVWGDLVYHSDIIQEKLERRILTQSVGMMKGKYATMNKATETTKPFFDVHGYDNKDFLHIARLTWFVHDYYLAGQTFAKSLRPLDQLPALADPRRELVAGIRSGKVPKDTAFAMAGHMLQMTNDIVDSKIGQFNDHDYEQLRRDLIGIIVQ